MAEIGLALGAIGAATAITGGIASITQGRSQADATEAVGRYNAALALTEATVAEERLRRDRARRQGALRASIGGKGITLAGTPLEIMADQAAEAEEEALLVRYMGAQRAAAIRFGAESQASFQKAQGLAQGIGLFGSAGTSLLTGFNVSGLFAGGEAGTGELAEAQASLASYGQGMFA